MTPRSSAIRRCRSVVLWLLLAALGHGEPGRLIAAEGAAPPKWPDDFGKQELINTYFVLLNPAVAAELKLTEAQIQSLKQQQTGPGGPERISDEELEKILPAEQLRRFRQIQLQRAAVLLGPMVLFRYRPVVERLELTEDQVPRFQAAYRAVQESFTARIRRPMTPDERKAQQTQIDLLLTVVQRARWMEMLGEPVSAEALQTNPLVRASQVQLRSPSPASAGPPAAVVYRRQEGGPLSTLAAVLRPAPIAKLRSWTIETRGHRGPLHAVAYSPDGRWIATGGSDGSIRVWDVPYQHLQQAFLGHHDRITALAFSPDGKYLASSSLDGAVGLWELASGRLVRMLLGHSAAVNDVN